MCWGVREVLESVLGCGEGRGRCGGCGEVLGEVCWSVGEVRGDVGVRKSVG